jgi:hypothetical protein
VGLLVEAQYVNLHLLLRDWLTGSCFGSGILLIFLGRVSAVQECLNNVH